LDVISAYIEEAPQQSREKLKIMHAFIRSIAPEATEKISWQMPTFYLNGNLVHFAGFARHVGLYPGANGVAAFEEALKPYKHAKGSIQFPLDQDLPLELIEKIVRFRVAEQKAMKGYRAKS